MIYKHRTCARLAGVLALAGACGWSGAQPPPPGAKPTGPSGPGAGTGPVLVQGVPYVKMGTRRATEERLYALAFPAPFTWGRWYAVGGFPFRPNADDLKNPLPPEGQLDRLALDGPGIDAGVTFGALAWKPIDYLGNRSLDLNQFCPEGDGVRKVVYLATTLTASEDFVLPVGMGSDDGLRVWLNGTLLVDIDVLRGLDPADHKVPLALRKGVNHLLVKVSNNQGAFEFQLNHRPQLDNYADTLLSYLLDRDFPASREGEFYPVHSVLVPDDVSLEVGGLDVLPDGRPLVATRRGELYIVDGAYDTPPFRARFARFAEGLHEPLGLTVRPGLGAKGWHALAVQRGELTRLVDTDGDDVADRFDTICDDWGVSGNYHEFAFGGRFDREGNCWVTLNVGFCGSLGKSLVPWRGWAVMVTPAGELVPVCDGLRSPNGVGMFGDGTMFYLDNQGDYVGTCRMSPLLPGSYAGHPAGLRWRQGYHEGDPAPEPTPATIWFPYRKMGQSAADFLSLPADAKDSPFASFAGQAFVGDQMMCSVMRCSIEKVEGVYQGACYPFREGLQCGVNRLAWAKDGTMFVGQTDRGWGSIGRKRYGLERIASSGEAPLELREMRIQPDGFELAFTRPVDPATAADPASYAMESYTYLYHATYGSPEVQREAPAIASATMLDDSRVRLVVRGLREGGMGFVHELAMPGVRAPGGEALLHDKAYYTLQRLPGGDR